MANKTQKQIREHIDKVLSILKNSNLDAIEKQTLMYPHLLEAYALTFKPLTTEK